MTREEASKSIQDFTGWFKKDKPIYEALEMAIQALSQECVEPTQKHVGNAMKMRCDDEIQAIQDLEQAEIQKAYALGQEDRPTGHWIFKKFDEKSGISDSYWCSKCNKPLASVYKNFCPNCGAKMESEDKK